MVFFSEKQASSKYGNNIVPDDAKYLDVIFKSCMSFVEIRKQTRSYGSRFYFTNPMRKGKMGIMMSASGQSMVSVATKQTDKQNREL